MKQSVNRIWLWAYLGPLFSFLGSLVSLYFYRDEALIPLIGSVLFLPATILWRRWGLLGATFFLTCFLFTTSFPLYQTFLSSLVVSSCFLALFTLDRMGRPIAFAEKEGKRGWERAKGLDAHLKEVQREHLKRISAFKGREETFREEAKRVRYLLNEARCVAYQQQLDLARLENGRPSTTSRLLMDQLAQLRSQFQEKDQELASARCERYVFETKLLEVEKRFNEERLNSYQESFWIAPEEVQEEKEDLEMLVGDLLDELKSRCVPSQSLDLSLLGK